LKLNKMDQELLANSTLSHYRIEAKPQKTSGANGKPKAFRKDSGRAVKVRA